MNNGSAAHVVRVIPGARGGKIDLSETLASGKSKVERYNWSSADTPGELRFVPKESLTVDDNYQREPNKDKVHAITQRLSWPAFGVLVVARRADGTLVVVDGQHRWMAAMKRADIRDVPVIIFDSDGTKMEAESFLKANTLRRAVTAIEKFKAQIEAEDPIALEVKRHIEAAGRKVGMNHSPQNVGCIALMYKLLSTDSKVFRKAWPVIVSACEGNPMHETVVAGVVHIEKNMLNGASLGDGRWRSRLRDIGEPELHRAAQEASAYYARGGAKVWATGILKRINKGIPDARRLTLANGAVAV